MFSVVNVGGVNQLQITLQDLFANPTSVGQLLSDLQFKVAGVSDLSLISSSAQSVSIAEGGTTTMGSTGSTGWIGGAFQGGFIVCVICPNNFGKTAGPGNLIIGPGPYTNANGSVAGNGPHNPFLNQTATFTLSGTGINANTVVSDVVFSFGTQFGTDVGGTAGPGGGTVPEPSSYLLSSIAFGALAVFARIKRRRAPADL